MMIQLRIQADDTVYTYGEDRLVYDGSASILESLRERDVEQGDVELTVAVSGEQTFLGVGSPFDLPDEGGDGYRAVLEEVDASGDAVRSLLSGVVYRSEIDSPLDEDDQPLGYGMTLLGAASEQMWERLDAVDLRALSIEAELLVDSIRPVTRTVRPVRDAPSDEPYDAHATIDRTWHELASVVRAVLLDTDGVTGNFDSLGTYATRYADGSGDEQVIERERRLHLFAEHSWRGGALPFEKASDTLPSWTGRQLVELVLAVSGKRLRAAFAPFPSREIGCTFFDASVPGGALPTLDAYLLDADYDVYRESGSGTLGVRMDGEIGEASLPQNLEQKRYYSDATTETAVRVALPPPAYASHAATRWLVEQAKRGETGRTPVADRLIEARAYLPQMSTSQTGRPDEAPGVRMDAAVVATPDAQGHPDYSERVTAGDPLVSYQEPLAYLGAFEQIDGQWKCVLERETLSPAPGDHALHCEAWASASLAARASETGDRVLMSAASAPPFEIGALEAVSVIGRDWRIAEREASLDDEGDRITLELVRAAPTLVPAWPRRVGVPLSLAATSIDSGRGTFAHVTWTPPPAADCLVRWYEVQYDSGAGWLPLVTTRATEAVHLARGADAIGYRVRAVSPLGETGEWADVRDEAVVSCVRSRLDCDLQARAGAAA